MDTSNPVIPQDRRTVEEILSLQILRRRQDLGYLRDVARTSERTELPVESPRLPEGEVKRIVAEYTSALPKVASSKTKEHPKCLRVFREEIPVSSMMLGGVPIHPPSVNNDKGRVSVNRTMGGVPRPPLGLADVTRIVAEEVLDVHKVYTSGTWKGFMTRLDKQMGRETVSIKETFKNVYGLSEKPKVSYMAKVLNKLFPREKTEWPSLGSQVTDLLKNIKVTASSSAGAPYWRNKGECMEEIITVGLAKAIEACQGGNEGVEALFHKDPEMFLCEIKNKMDRYDIDKLEEKTRPYCCVPAHWALLFSILAQRYQDGLETFEKKFRGSNAYGFSAVKGGLTRMYEWMQTADERGKFVCYGDDTCLVVRRNGQIWRVDPDFQQMDGSIDAEDIRLTIQYVVETLAREDNLDDMQRGFWVQVGKVWETIASDPILILDGPRIYKKVRPNGLLSGVPGTTLFDTFKSGLAWHAYLDTCQMSGLNPLDEAVATKFMKMQGLIIKPGTWDPQIVPELVVGNLITDHKFLGVQMLVETYNGSPVVVPTVPFHEALEMILVQKDNPWGKRDSEMTMKRRLYDRMRGLFMTVGFTHPQIIDAIHETVNNLDPAAILMCTNIGTGERPEQIIMEDYAYPDSSGFPTVDYCKALFSGSDESEHWISLFPGLEDLLQVLRLERRGVERSVHIEDSHGQKLIKPVLREISTQVDLTDLELPDAECYVKPAGVSLKAEAVPPRAHIDNASRLPNLGESIVASLQEPVVAHVGEICYRFCINPKQLRTAAEQYGLYMTGDNDDDLVSIAPICEPEPAYQNALAQDSAHKADVVSRGVERRVAVKKDLAKPEQAPQVVVTAPTRVLIGKEFLDELPGKPPGIDEGADLVDRFSKYVARGRNITALRWRTLEVLPNTPSPVWECLEIKFKQNPAWLVVTQCNGTSARLCKEYMAQAVLSEKKLLHTQKGRRLPFQAFTLHTVEAPGQLSWVEEVEAEIRTAYDAPPPTIQTVEDLNLPQILGESGFLPEDLDKALKCYRILQKHGATKDTAVSTLQKVGACRRELRSRSVSPLRETLHDLEQSQEAEALHTQVQAEIRSKRWVKFRGTSEKRTKENRRILEKRKRRRSERRSIAVEP
nr:RNA-dependent RNA polymerase [Hypera postica associated permutotetravirus]